MLPTLPTPPFSAAHAPVEKAHRLRFPPGAAHAAHATPPFSAAHAPVEKDTKQSVNKRIHVRYTFLFW